MSSLIHLSDLHYCTDRHDIVRDLLSEVRGMDSDHVVISGDLVSSGSWEEMCGLHGLLIEMGFHSSRKLTVVPGNHDIFGFIYQLFDSPDGVLGRIRTPRDLMNVTRKLWRFRNQLHAYNHTDYSTDLRRFRTWFALFFTDCLTLGGYQDHFPFAKLIGDDLAIIGVDSNRCIPRVFHLLNVLLSGRRVIRTQDVTLLGENLSGSTGSVDTYALDTILTHPLIENRRKIVVLHHCLYDMQELTNREVPGSAMEMRLINRDQVVSVLQRHGVDLVFHGHFHASESYLAGNSIRVINGGGAYDGGITMLDISANKERIDGINHILPNSTGKHMDARFDRRSSTGGDALFSEDPYNGDIVFG